MLYACVCIIRVCVLRVCVCITRVCVLRACVYAENVRLPTVDGTGRDDDGNRAVHAVRRCGDVAFEDVVFAVPRSRRRNGGTFVRFRRAVLQSHASPNVRALYVFLTHSLSPFYLTLSMPPSLFRFFFYGRRRNARAYVPYAFYFSVRIKKNTPPPRQP